MIVVTVFHLTKLNSVWCYIGRKSVITIQKWFDLTRFEINFSVFMFALPDSDIKDFYAWYIYIYIYTTYIVVRNETDTIELGK